MKFITSFGEIAKGLCEKDKKIIGKWAIEKYLFWWLSIGKPNKTSSYTGGKLTTLEDIAIACGYEKELRRLLIKAIKKKGL